MNLDFIWLAAFCSFVVFIYSWLGRSIMLGVDKIVEKRRPKILVFLLIRIALLSGIISTIADSLPLRITYVDQLQRLKLIYNFFSSIVVLALVAWALLIYFARKDKA